MIDNNISVKTNTQINDSNLNKPKVKTEQVLPFDIVDPTKVTKTPKKNNSDQTGQNQLNYNPDSVFDKFIKSLQNSPVLADGAKKLLLNKQFINHSIKNDPALSTLFESFMQSIQMNDTEILSFLKFQHNTYTKFNGEFFDTLRNLINNNPNNIDLKTTVRNFLRSYDSFVSMEDINKSINAALNNIKNNLPEILIKPFEEMTNKLIQENSKGLDLNLNLLKQEILPFVGRYIAKMNDFGPVRDYVSVLVHNMVRLDAASKNNFADNLDNLFDYIRYNFNVDDKDMESFKLSLINTYESSSNANNKSIVSFLKLLESGVKDSENLVNKGLMEEMTESLLFSQNVHIPLTHMFLPLDYKGTFMFSELWIGKSYEEISDNNKKKKHSYSQVYKVFLTFDIQNLGYFETTVILKESKLALDIYVPSSISNDIDQIKNDIKNILGKNNISVSNLSVKESIKKRKFNEVFSNLTERKSGVDVTI